MRKINQKWAIVKQWRQQKVRIVVRSPKPPISPRNAEDVKKSLDPVLEKKVTFKDIEPRGQLPGAEVEQIMKTQEYVQAPRVNQYLQTVVDFIPRNNMAFYQFDHAFSEQSESHLHKSVLKLLSGHGAKKDHPRVQELMHHSLLPYPDLLHLYNASWVDFWFIKVEHFFVGLYPLLTLNGFDKIVKFKIPTYSAIFFKATGNSRNADPKNSGCE